MVDLLLQPTSGRALFLLTYVAAMAAFFRGQLASGLDRGFSDRADGMIEISILEHWRNVLSGASTWNVTKHFYPYPDTLGYNDGYFLYGLVYSFWRLIADPLLADTLNIATFKTIGFCAAYALVARALRWGRGAGLVVAFVFTNANGLMVQAGHVQLQSVALMPVAMLLAVAISQAERASRRRAACCAAVVLALLMAAWLLTAYYTAWFTIFFTAVFVLCWMLTTGHWRPQSLLRLAIRYSRIVEVGGIAFFVAIMPFLIVYLPKIRETGGQGYAAVLPYLANPLDVINVGPSNYLWGWLLRLRPEAFPGGEHITGVPLLLFGLAVAALCWGIFRPATVSDQPFKGVLRAFALAIVACWLLTLQIRSFSAWAFVFDFVPGAKGLRVVTRFQLVLLLPTLLVVVAAFRQRAAVWAQRHPLLLSIATALLIVEQFGSDVPVQISRSIDGAALSAVPPPPNTCRSFYVVSTRRNEPIYVDAARTAVYPHNVDAMLLAELWRVPTINGLSTFNPRDWDFSEPDTASYDARVAFYLAHHHVTGVCRLDVRQAKPWRRVS